MGREELSMGAILGIGAGLLLFGWWFMATYGDPGKVVLLFVLGSIAVSFLAGKWFSKHRED
jgi:hypothetical protein